VVLIDDQVSAVVPRAAFEAGPADTVIDVTGCYVLPGLIDAHFHLVSRSATTVTEDVVSLGSVEGVVNAADRLRAGVTTVRDAGCRHRGIHALMRAIRAGVVVGPRAFIAGRNPTGPLAPSHWRNVIVRGPDDMRSAVRAELDGGADWVKFVIGHAEDPSDWSRVTPYLTEEEIRAGVQEAHAHAVRVGVHCEGVDMARVAVRSGVDTLDHAPLLDDETVEQMAASGTAYVPTLWAFSDDSGLADTPASTSAQAAVRFWQEEHRRSVRRAAAAGVLIAAGSDAAGSLPGGDVLVREIAALINAGLGSARALRAATLDAARVIGAEDRLGSLQPGKAADVVIVDRDPLTDVWTLARPLMVVARGRVMLNRRTNQDLLPVAPSQEAARDLAGLTSRWRGDDDER